MTTSQASMGLPHAGQLRYHDYHKLRELHQARLHRSAENARGVRFLSTAARNKGHHSNNSSNNVSFPLGAGSYALTMTGADRTVGERSFWTGNPLKKALRDSELKRLEREANQDPQNAVLQHQFLQELAQDHPEAVLERIQNPAFRDFAVNTDSAILYLQLLQKHPQPGGGALDPDELLRRVGKAPPTQRDFAMGRASPILLSQEWRDELAQHKWSKAEQLPHLLRLLSYGTLAKMSSSPANFLPPPNFLSSQGLDPKQPLHVKVISPGGGASSWMAVATFTLARVVVAFVIVSAFGALIDDRGLGRGMGINSNSKHVQEADPLSGRKIKFEDVKGVEEAKAELEEIVLYLRDPSRFTRLGGQLPRGLLLTGPPGTGKTLLAKAIAGEADVPFFYSSGSQFEEVYVGLGAKRIRELFEAAKKKAPAIVFIDEIDAVGGTRRLKDQSALKMTLNELLVQMDGFEENNGIIVIGATNFMESLDPALLRPGRFDKHVSVPLPDVGGRKEILEMYAKKTKLAKDVDLNVLARGTTGFSGADLYNLMNQAALKASMDGLNSITMSVLEYAKDKILMGAERKSAVITPETAKCTAYHEAGHALVAVLTEGAQPIHKATIMPRGTALGMVTMLPEGDQTSQSLKEMLAFMDVAMGGRVAEELVFGKQEVTSGAMSDIQVATRLARNMVTKYGFSEEVGIVFYGGASGEDTASSETRARIDAEVKKLTDAAYRRAKDLLTKHAFEHRLLAETLLEYETLTGEEVINLVKKHVKPQRPVLNKENGRRGDQSVVKSGKGSDGRGTKTRIPGMGKDVSPATTDGMDEKRR